MEHVAAIPFEEPKGGGTLMVRAQEGIVQVGILHMRHGDISALLTVEEAGELIEALRVALEKT
jgi:hypothetical protein